MNADRISTLSVRQRIQAIYDPEVFLQAGNQIVALLSQHFRDVQDGRGNVLNWNDPKANIAIAKDFLRMGTQHPASIRENEMNLDDLSDRVKDLVQTVLTRGQNLHHPRYLGHQVPASIPLAGLFDAIGSITNQVMAIYEMGPWATSVEQAFIETLGQEIGFEMDQFAGLVTHGGSLANLTALLTARNVALSDVWEEGLSEARKAPVLLVHADAHYSVSRAAGILGLGTRQILRVPLDERRRMDPDELDRMLTDCKATGRPVISVVAAACATPIGAFDILPDIAGICRKHDVWMHVDAAHGGAACLSEKYGHLVEGLHLADSVVLDGHKMMFAPALNAFVFYRNREHRFEAFRQDAPYLFDPSAPGLSEHDSGMKTIECTKRAAVLGLWATWSLFGRQLFSDLVDVTFDLGRTLFEKLNAAPEFESIHEPQCNIVVFRYLPNEIRDLSATKQGEFQLALRREVMQSGEFYLVPCKLDGEGALRVTLINPLTTPDHLDELLETLRRFGRRLLGSGFSFRDDTGTD